ncbi:MAG TPA: protein kinase [Gemmatimonadales bacterium]
MTQLLQQLQHALGERYIVERELGRGGMAFVYLARDRRYERPVAIKVLDPEIATAVGAERFLREVRITAQLQHTHIVPLLDSGEARGLLYAVMPFVEGESLRQRLMAQGRLPAAEAVSIACEVADALDYAHRRGVIHRDIKPENILISNGHAVVADFGVARAIGLAGGATLTGVGIPIGTAAYMSPEQATASSPADGRSDVYSLGCVLYEMLAGRMAFSGPSLKSVLTQQLTTEPPLDHLARLDVPPQVVAIVQRCLRKHPDDRYPSAGEMAEALRGSLAALPRLSTPVPQVPAGAEGGGLFAGAGKWLVPAALAALVGLGATLFLGGDSPPNTPEPSGPYTASVAVLPFDNLNGNPEDTYFSEGITEEIISQLAQVESLKVISRTSVLALKGSQLTLGQIADTLGVRHIVEGSVRRQGSRVRVTAQLIEAASDAHLWAGSFEGDLADSFRVQEEIARKVSGQLLSSIRGLRPMPAAAMPSQSAAFDALLRGRYLLERRTPEGIQEAIEAFEAAIAADSNYAPAYAGLSSAYLLHVVYGYPGGVPPYAAAARARWLADRAVRLDFNLAEAHVARSDAMLIGQDSHAEALEELRTAQRLMPSSAEVHMSAAHALGHTGQWDAALRQAQRALALDPLSTGLRHSMITLALGARRYDLALAETRRARSFTPGDRVTALLQAYALLLGGDAAECLRLELEGWHAVRAMCLEAAGRAAESQALADSIARRLRSGTYQILHEYADMAAFDARRGDAAGALAWLEESVRLTPMLHYWHLSSGLFDRVRAQPEFAAGVARLEEQVRDRVEAERRAVDGPAP